MDLAALDIKIGADFSKLQKDLAGASVVVDKFSKDMAAVGSNSAAATGGMQAISVGAEKMAASFSKVNAQNLPGEIDETSEASRRLQRQFAAFAGVNPFKNAGVDLSKFSLSVKDIPAKLDAAKKSSGSATIALTNLGRVAQDLPFGFIGIANNLNPLLESFQALQAQAKATGTSLKTTLIGALTGPAGLGLALSVVSAALTFAQVGFAAWTRGFETAKKSSDEFKDSIASMSASLNTELTSMSALISVARDYSASQKTRQNAIDELQKRYPGYLSNLNLENINSQETANAIEKLTGALERKALVQAYSNLLTKAQEDLIKQQNTSLEDQIGFFEKIGAVLKGSGNVAIAVSKGTATALENQAASTKVLQDAVDSYSKRLSELTAQQAEENDFKLIDPTKAAKSKKDIENIADVLEKLRLNLTALDTREFEEGLNLSSEKIREIEGVIEKLIVDFQVKPDDTIINKLFGDIKDIRFSAQNFKEFIQNLEKSLPAEAIPDVPIEVKPVFDRLGAADAIRRFSIFLEAKKLGVELPVNFSVANTTELDALEKKLAAIKDRIQKMNESVQLFLSGLATDSLVAFGEAIGAVAAGADASGIFENLFQTIGSGLKTLGKTMIEVSGLIAAIKTALSTLNPVLAIAAGIALTALGSFIENSAPKLAQGGIVPAGFPNDTYPALLSSNEAVIPLDKGLGKFLNTNTEPILIIPEARISGNDIVISYERTQRKNKRTF